MSKYKRLARLEAKAGKSGALTLETVATLCQSIERKLETGSALTQAEQGLLPVYQEAETMAANLRQEARAAWPL